MKKLIATLFILLTSLTLIACDANEFAIQGEDVSAEDFSLIIQTVDMQSFLGGYQVSMGIDGTTTTDGSSAKVSMKYEMSESFGSYAEEYKKVEKVTVSGNEPMVGDYSMTTYVFQDSQKIYNSYDFLGESTKYYYDNVLDQSQYDTLKSEYQSQIEEAMLSLDDTIDLDLIEETYLELIAAGLTIKLDNRNGQRVLGIVFVGKLSDLISDDLSDLIPTDELDLDSLKDMEIKMKLELFFEDDSLVGIDCLLQVKGSLDLGIEGLPITGSFDGKISLSVKSNIDESLYLTTAQKQEYLPLY